MPRSIQKQAEQWPQRVAAGPSRLRHVILPTGDPETAWAILHGHARDLGGGRYARHALLEGLESDPSAVFEELRHGGFTLHDHTGKLPANGYMVSRYGAERARPIAEMTPQDIADYEQKNAAELEQPGRHLGGWLANVGNVPHGYLDISRHYPRLTPAIEAAARNGQLGIYDLGGGKTVMPAGGTWLQGNRL